MITAVDTAILLDALDQTSDHHLRARQALDRARQVGRVVASDPVWAEGSARFPSAAAFARALDGVGVEFDTLNCVAALEAGDAWRRFRKSGAAARERLPTDFLVGAHALVQSDALLTYPRGFFGRFFRTLRLSGL